MRKSSKLRRFDVDKIYIADTSKERILVYKENEDKYSKLSFKSIDNLQNFYSLYREKDLKIVSDLRSAVIRNDLEVLLLDKDGNESKQLIEQEAVIIFRIIRKKSNLSPSQILQINRISYKATSIISDLLGINVTCNSNSRYDFKERNIEEIIVPAWKVITFQNTLLNYIKAKLMYDGNVYISNYGDGMDYKLHRSLIKSKIAINDKMRKNTFSFSINKNCNIVVDGKNLNNNFEIQKIIKF